MSEMTRKKARKVSFEEYWTEDARRIHRSRQEKRANEAAERYFKFKYQERKYEDVCGTIEQIPCNPKNMANIELSVIYRDTAAGINLYLCHNDLSKMILEYIDEITTIVDVPKSLLSL